jgi:hypothetical protein
MRDGLKKKTFWMMRWWDHLTNPITDHHFTRYIRIVQKEREEQRNGIVGEEHHARRQLLEQ